ncbi:MAG: hypothetical protein ACRYG2_38075, partial [Janthinobacterium lividum]
MPQALTTDVAAVSGQLTVQPWRGCALLTVSSATYPPGQELWSLQSAVVVADEPDATAAADGVVVADGVTLGLAEAVGVAEGVGPLVRRSLVLLGVGAVVLVLGCTAVGLP